METESTLAQNITTNVGAYTRNSSNVTARVQYFQQSTIIILHTLYVTVLFVGVFGNILTCAVISFRRCMRRSIHLYTFNLAVADLLILIFYVPTQMIYTQHQLNWTMGVSICKVVNVILPVALVTTILTLLAITLDRARALAKPFDWRAASKKSSQIVIPGIWVVGSIISLPLFYNPKLGVDNGDIYCSDGFPSTQVEFAYWTAMFVVVFLIPLLIIIITHAYMISSMMSDKSSIHRTHNKRMIRMIILLVLVFTICTGMQHVNFLYSAYISTDFKPILFAVSNFVVSLQAALNPVIYGTLRHDFNAAFRNWLYRLLKKFGIVTGDPIDSTLIGKKVSNSSMYDRTSFDIMFDDVRKGKPVGIPKRQFSKKLKIPSLHNKLVIDANVTPKMLRKDHPLTSSYDSIDGSVESKLYVKGATIKTENGYVRRPEIVITDNYDSSISEDFCEAYSRETLPHITDTPLHPPRRTDAQLKEIRRRERLMDRLMMDDEKVDTTEPLWTPLGSNRISRVLEKMKNSKETVI